MIQLMNLSGEEVPGAGLQWAAAESGLTHNDQTRKNINICVSLLWDQILNYFFLMSLSLYYGQQCTDTHYSIL